METRDIFNTWYLMWVLTCSVMISLIHRCYLSQVIFSEQVREGKQQEKRNELRGVEKDLINYAKNSCALAS